MPRDTGIIVEVLMWGVGTANSRQSTAKPGWLRKGDLGGLCFKEKSEDTEEGGKLIGEGEG